MDSKQDKINLAEEAKSLLENPVFKKVCENYTTAQLVVILGTPPGDLTSQAACAKMQAIAGIKEELQVLINNGIMAQKVR